jgi:DNA-directed RNA polymerase specialized sigma24 family protein
MPSSPTREPASPPFERLLRALDPDRDRAGERYETLRRKLVRLFGWRGCLEAEQCADETLDRVARRLAEGAVVPDLFGFCHGVAMNVLHEHWRRVERQPASLEALPEVLVPAVDPARVAQQREERGHAEARLGCLDGCLAVLDAHAREMLLRYHPAEGGSARARRQLLAEELGVPLNALRIRVHRVRARLARCIEGCLARRPRGQGTPS